VFSSLQTTLAVTLSVVVSFLFTISLLRPPTIDYPTLTLKITLSP